MFRFLLIITVVCLKETLCLQCYSCNTAFGEVCSGNNVTVQDCSVSAGPIMDAILKDLRRVCVHLFASSKSGDQFISKTCSVDLNFMDLDVCEMTKSAIKTMAQQQLKNVQCSICDTDKCNSQMI